MLEFDINHSQISYSLKTHEQYSVAAGGENYGLGNFLVDYEDRTRVQQRYVAVSGLCGEILCL